MDRVIGPVAVVFKGSGFHVNDYKSSGVKREARKEDTTGEKTEVSKTDAPPAAEAAAPPKDDGTKKESIASSKSETAAAKTPEKKKEVA